MQASVEAQLTTAAVLSLYARVHRLTPHTDASVLHPDVRAVLEDRLREQGTEPADISWIEGLVSAAQSHISSDSAQPLSAVAYDQARRRCVSRLGRAGSAGVRLWPPTSQTVRAQLGDQQWNVAMRSLGIPVSTRGRIPGPTRFSHADYVRAVRDFTTASPHDQSFRAYCEWVSRESAAGSVRPSGPGLRKFFGSWSAAKDSATAADPA